MAGSKQKVLVGNYLYDYEEVSEPVVRNGRRLALYFDHRARRIRLLRSIPESQKKFILAAGVSDVCRRLWRPIPVLSENWTDGESLRLGTRGGRGPRP